VPRQGFQVTGRLLALLGLRSARDDEDISATRNAWPEFTVEWERGAWRAYLYGAAEPTASGKTPADLRAAISAAWVTGSTR